MGKGRKKASKEDKAQRMDAAEQAASTTEEEEDTRCFLCSADGKARCGSCGQVYFCSEEHGKLHRPENLCFPFRVAEKPGVGRCLVATRDIQPLELVLYDRTLALGPKAGSAPVCLGCLGAVGNGDDSHSCSGCGWPLCGACSTKKVSSSSSSGGGGVGGHADEECRILAAAKGKVCFSDLSSPHEHFRCVAPLRLLLLRDSRPEFHDRFRFLMDHDAERRDADPELYQKYRKYVNRFLRDDCGLAERFSEAEVDRAVGIYWTNSFSCSSGGGQAVYPTFSFASHSCISNSNPVVFPNRHLALQTKVLVRKGEELTISYISPIQSTMRRRAKLRDKWFFECACARCADPTERGSHVSALVCQNCPTGGRRCGGTVEMARTSGDQASGNESSGEEVWACRKCGFVVSKENVLYLENSLATQLQQVEDRNDLASFRRLHEEHLQILHPGHYLLLLLRRHIVVLSSPQFQDMTLAELQEMKAMCEQVLQVLNVIDPGYNRDRGVILRHLSEVSKILCRKMFQQELISQERFTRRVHECMILFEESQRCMSMLVKK